MMKTTRTQQFATMLSALGLTVSHVDVMLDGKCLDTGYVIYDAKTRQYIAKSDEKVHIYKTALEIISDIQHQIDYHIKRKLLRAIADNNFSMHVFENTENGTITNETINRVGDILQNSRSKNAKNFYEQHKSDFELFDTLSQHCPNIDLDSLNNADTCKHISSLGLSTRAVNGLKRYNIETINQLANKTEQELLAIRNLGENSVLEIKRALSKAGLHLRK